MADSPAAITARAAAASAGLSGAFGNARRSCPNVTLEIGVFFDGTGNNEANALAGGRDGSYATARTNVSLLRALYKLPASDVRNACGGFARRYGVIYKQGPGTTAGRGDSNLGLAFGMGATGVEQRVYEACLEVGTMVGLKSPGVEPTEIIMDVFGFSRGAAAARYFVNCFRQGFITYDRNFVNRRRAYLPPGRRVRFRFIGIFDTVAAIGIGTNDDNGPVNVHLAAAQATRIFHLTAMNEHRANFRLNHNLPGGGEAQALPGAHSDIGGGYGDAGDEVVLREWTEVHASQAMAEAARRRLLAPVTTPVAETAPWRAEGFMTDAERQPVIRHEAGPVRPAYGMMGSAMTYGFSARRIMTRPWVRPGLSRIALRIMYDRALAAGVPFNAFPQAEAYTVPAALQPVAGKLRAGQALTPDEHRATIRGFGHVSDSPTALGMQADRNRRRVVYPNRPGEAK